MLRRERLLVVYLVCHDRPDRHDLHKKGTCSIHFEAHLVDVNDHPHGSHGRGPEAMRMLVEMPGSTLPRSIPGRGSGLQSATLTGSAVVTVRGRPRSDVSNTGAKQTSVPSTFGGATSAWATDAAECGGSLSQRAVLFFLFLIHLPPHFCTTNYGYIYIEDG